MSETRFPIEVACPDVGIAPNLMIKNEIKKAGMNCNSPNVIKHGDGVSLELLTKKASIRVIKDSELFEPEHRILMSKELLVQDVSATDKLLHNIMECSITLNAQFEEFLMKELAPLNEAGKDVEGKALTQEKWPIPIDVKKSLHKKRGPTRPSSSLNAS